MSKMIQLRNVPDELHHRLKARAALAGMTLSDFLIAEVARAAARPTLGEMRERLHARASVEPKKSVVRMIRGGRGAL
jgi:plasmid stability protein